jgi:hypothetical protein
MTSKSGNFEVDDECKTWVGGGLGMVQQVAESASVKP